MRASWVTFPVAVFVATACAVSVTAGQVGCNPPSKGYVTRDQFASYAGVAPVERSSGGRIFFRLSRRGNRQLNHAIHMVAICQIRQTNSEGRIYFEKKVAEGKTKREAIRSLKRQVSNAVYRRLLIDAEK